MPTVGKFEMQEVRIGWNPLLETLEGPQVAGVH